MGVSYCLWWSRFVFDVGRSYSWMPLNGLWACICPSTLACVINTYKYIHITYVYVYIYMCLYVYTYIYIHRCAWVFCLHEVWRCVTLFHINCGGRVCSVMLVLLLVSSLLCLILFVYLCITAWAYFVVVYILVYYVLCSGIVWVVVGLPLGPFFLLQDGTVVLSCRLMFRCDLYWLLGGVVVYLIW